MEIELARAAARFLAERSRVAAHMGPAALLLVQRLALSSDSEDPVRRAVIDELFPAAVRHRWNLPSADLIVGECTACGAAFAEALRYRACAAREARGLTPSADADTPLQGERGTAKSGSQQ